MTYPILTLMVLSRDEASEEIKTQIICTHLHKLDRETLYYP